MSIRILFTILLSIVGIFCKCQQVDGKFDHFTVDTFYLKQLKAKKVVVYKLSTVTVYVNYKDFLKDLSKTWKVYKRGMKLSLKSKYVNPEYEPRWHVIDSIYQSVKKLFSKQDTMYVFQSTFNKVGLREMMNFGIQIEKGNCLIFDNNNINQPVIIRQKGSWQRGPLQGWGGRRYFLPDRSIYFYEESDWYS